MQTACYAGLPAAVAALSAAAVSLEENILTPRLARLDVLGVAGASSKPMSP